MDQRTRKLGGRAGRVILLGDGTEIMTDHHDDDAAMVDHSEDEEKDLESQVKKGQDAAKSEGTDTSVPEKLDSQDKTAQQQTSDSDPTPEEPKMMAATDSADSKILATHMDSKH